MLHREFRVTPELEFARDITRALRARGKEGLIAGGYVRDVENPNDLDMATTESPDGMLTLDVPNCHKVPTGIDYGTVSFVRVAGEENIVVEVTTCREDHGASDNRRDVKPKFCYNKDTAFQLDAMRRDLTINSLMADPFTGKIYDWVGGLTDLENRVIRFNRGAVEACRDDALRLLRGVGFAARLSFTVTTDIFDAACDSVVRRRLSKLSGERIRDELLRILKSNNAAWGISMLQQLGVMELWLPELCCMLDCEQNIYHTHDVWGHTLLGLSSIEHASLEVKLAFLFHDSGKPFTQEMLRGEDYGYSFHRHHMASVDVLQGIAETRLKLFSNSGKYPVNMEQVYHLVEAHMSSFGGKDASMNNRLKHTGISKFGPEMLDKSWDMFWADAHGRNIYLEDSVKSTDVLIDEMRRRYNLIRDYLAKENTAFTVKQLAINGHAVMRLLGIKPSKEVGNTLNGLLEAVSNELVENRREALEEYLLSNYKNQL